MISSTDGAKSNVYVNMPNMRIISIKAEDCKFEINEQ